MVPNSRKSLPWDSAREPRIMFSSKVTHIDIYDGLVEDVEDPYCQIVVFDKTETAGRVLLAEGTLA